MFIILFYNQKFQAGVQDQLLYRVLKANLKLYNFFYSVVSRYHKCVACYDKLLMARSILLKKQTMPGKLGATFRELGSLIRTLE